MTTPKIATPMDAYRYPIPAEDIVRHRLTITWTRGPDEAIPDGPTVFEHDEPVKTVTPEQLVQQFVREMQESLDNTGEPVGSFEVDRIIIEGEHHLLADLEVPNGADDSAGGKLRRTPISQQEVPARPTYDARWLDVLLQEAEAAFWAVIQKACPGTEASRAPEPGDLYMAHKRAVLQWLQANDPLWILKQVCRLLEDARPDWKPAIEHPGYISLQVARRRTFDVSIMEVADGRVKLEGDCKQHSVDEGRQLRDTLLGWCDSDIDAIAGMIKHEVEGWGY